MTWWERTWLRNLSLFILLVFFVASSLGLGYYYYVSVRMDRIEDSLDLIKERFEELFGEPPTQQQMERWRDSIERRYKEQRQ